MGARAPAPLTPAGAAVKLPLIAPLLLAALLSLPASAQTEARDETGVPAQKAREKVEALPEAARVELKKMYRRYGEVVARRLESGWETGVLSEAVIEDVDEPFRPARLIDETIAQRKKEIARLQAAYEKGGGDDPVGTRRLRRALEDKKDELAALVSSNRREKGLCRDWSDAVWFELRGMNLENWSVRDERRAARPFHTAAVACSPAEEPSVCLAFDPWADGRPSVFAYDAWDRADAGGRFPADFFLHALPDKAAEKKP